MFRFAVAFAVVVGVGGTVWAAEPADVLTAVQRGDHQALRSLIARKTAADAAQPDGTTPLHWAVRQGDLESARLLVAAGADPNRANRYGVTPLPLAAANGDAAMVSFLLAH